MSVQRHSLALLPRPHGLPAVEWDIGESLVSYEDAFARMEERAAAIAEGRAAELVWLLEHPPLYTAGTSARAGSTVPRPSSTGTSSSAS